MNQPLINPYMPGAGHPPPYLAGREDETLEFQRLLGQQRILENLILTGLRGAGKTVLLEAFKPLAVQQNWLWVGTDLSESASLNEENLATRLLTDLSLVTSNTIVYSQAVQGIGFQKQMETVNYLLNYKTLRAIYEDCPGLVSDKLKHVLEFCWMHLSRQHAKKGIIFAYDEAQNLTDHAAKEQYPASILLDIFQSLQRKGYPFLLVLTGLPTLFPTLVNCRTFSERMFRVMFLKRLSESESRKAILTPLERNSIKFSPKIVDAIVTLSGGYPYFIQFTCKELYDWKLQHPETNDDTPLPIAEILRKLDSDFFAGRWAKATDRQRELLTVIAFLDHHDGEFTIQEIVDGARTLPKPFSASHVTQMLSSLCSAGLVYKNRHGKYAFAVPLLGQFILRQIEEAKYKRS